MVLPLLAALAGPATAADAIDFLRRGGGDTDGDGLRDRAELALGTDPRVADTDGDGWGDWSEVTTGGDCADPAVTP